MTTRPFITFETIPAIAPSQVPRGAVAGTSSNSRVAPVRANAPATEYEPAAKADPHSVAGNEFLFPIASARTMRGPTPQGGVGVDPRHAPGQRAFLDPIGSPLKLGQLAQTAIDVVAVVFSFLFVIITAASVLAAIFILVFVEL